MKRKVQISATYLVEYDEDDLAECFDEIKNEDDESFAEAAKIKFLNENMNDFKPNDIEIKVISEKDKELDSILRKLSCLLDSLYEYCDEDEDQQGYICEVEDELHDCLKKRGLSI